MKQIFCQLIIIILSACIVDFVTQVKINLYFSVTTVFKKTKLHETHVHVQYNYGEALWFLQMKHE